MTKYLLISLLTIILFACGQTKPIPRGANATDTSADIWTDTARHILRIEIQAKAIQFGGLCIIKQEEQTLMGSIVNEFGIKAFDFVIIGERCQLLSVNALLDKGYIRRTLEKDLYFLFRTDDRATTFYMEQERYTQDNLLIVNYKGRQIVKQPDGTITLSNHRYGLTYSLRKIAEIDRKQLL